MSNETDNWQAPQGAWTILPMRVQQSRRIRSSSKSVLAALAYFARRSTTCWPTHSTLAAAAGVSPATVKRALDQLNVAGLVTWNRRSGRRASLYHLKLPRTHRQRQNSSIHDREIAHSEPQKSSTLPGRRRSKFKRAKYTTGKAAAERTAGIAAALTDWSSAPVSPTSAIARKVAKLPGDTEELRIYISHRGDELSRRAGLRNADGRSPASPGLLAHVVSADWQQRSKK